MYSILYTKGCEELKVEAKDIPIIQRFMTEFWKVIKEFYQVELTDDYSEQACNRLYELGELVGICPDQNDKQFILDCILALNNALSSKQRGLIKNVQHKE